MTGTSAWLIGATPRRRTVVQGLFSVGLTALLTKKGHAEAADAVVETALGKLRGLAVGGVRIFKGIPYAASTAASNRFLPPQPLKPWAGIRDATEVGNAAPQGKPPPIPLVSWYFDIPPISEDCLFLNVYTPGSRTGARKPVMFWIHGGAWSLGSGSAPGFDARTLAHLGDVVVVTVNHRLGVFGYLQLDDDDERFAESGNVGMLDLVAALRWVRENIGMFGGDPANVTILGHSGGGAKVAALMTMPSAKGLFHKVVSQSSQGVTKLLEKEDAAKAAHEVAQRLQIPKASGAALQQVPMDQLLAVRAGPFRAVLDGHTLPRHPFAPDAPPLAAQIPFLAGNTGTEATHILSIDRRNFALDSAAVHARVARTLEVDASEASRLIDAYRAQQPTASPSDLLVAIQSDAQFVRYTTREAALQSKQAPTYVYMFNWRTPVWDGVLRSPHTVEVPFMFGTTAAAAEMLGNGPELSPLTRMMISTWSAFAHNGNPNNETVPNWPRYDGEGRSTMVLDVASRIERDPGGQARAAFDGLPYA